MPETIRCVSVIIPTFNGGELFREVLEMVFAQDIACELEVIVIDSGSSDETLDICSAYPVNLIEIPSASFNHSRTRNLAIERAKGEVCVLTVQDATPVDSLWLQNLIRPMVVDEEVAGVFGQQLSRPETSPLSRCCKLLWYREWDDNWQQGRKRSPLSEKEWDGLSTEEQKQYSRFDNVNSCLRKSVWQKVPFPDVHYGEDIAWAKAVLCAGHAIYWEPEARVYHSHDRSLAYLFKRSYVDAKTSAQFFGESPSLPTVSDVHALLEWLLQRADEYIATATRSNTPERQKEGGMDKVDVSWQQSSKQYGAIVEEGREKPAGDWLRSSVYTSLAGPRWLRQLCREIAGKGGFFKSKKQIPGEPGKRYLLELQGRYRFFLNQLLHIHFSYSQKNRGVLATIRLGAVVMVAGSMLGQSMALFEADPGTTKRELLQEKESFWEGLEQWSALGWTSESEGLWQLDQLLDDGI